ncbi:hypothetical protein JCM19992_32940 [Thermostilla marina]
MSSVSIDIRLDGRKVRYEPGDVLSGEFVLRDVRRSEIRAVELSVLWYTDGKGDQDLHVHHFRRWSSEQGDWIDPRRPVRFETELPASPLSYEGLIVRVQWCVRVRVFLTDGRDELVEIPFRLGGVARARVKVR